jgi:hypothetical protein
MPAWDTRLTRRGTRISASAYTEATGDNNPTDGSNERFDTPFGARRWEFGPTGIYGLIACSNLRSPDWQIAVRPKPNLELSFTHRFVWLESARDAWTAAGVRDSSGNSGNYLGQQLETRFRYDMVPGNVRFDTGFVYFANGDFPHPQRHPPGQHGLHLRGADLDLLNRATGQPSD